MLTNPAGNEEVDDCNSLCICTPMPLVGRTFLMTGFIEAAKVSEFRDGMMKKVLIGDNSILLAMVNGRFYATDPLCPHLQADLSAGSLEGRILTCPLHNSRFDLRDGHVVRWTDLKGTVLTYAKKAKPPRPLKTYPVRIEGDKILVAIS